MGNVCRICQKPCSKFIPLTEESSNLKELKEQGKEFEYCFDLKVLEVPKYIGICSQCQEQLHSFYLFKQKAIKSHYELLHKANEIKKKQNVEEELLNESGNVERIETENSKSDCVVLNETIKNEFEKDGEDGECDNSMNFSANTANDDNDNSRNNDDNETESEKKNDSKLKLPESKQKSDKQNSLNKVLRFECEICGKRFMIEERYIAHMNTHKGLPEYSCETCGKGYKSKTLYDGHIKSHKNQRDYVCEICSKAFLTKHTLCVHMECHNDKQIVCDECGKLFRYSFQLTVHKETHSEEKLECSICHAKLNTKGTLKGHMRAVHGLFRNPTLYCTLCQKYFSKKYRLKNHMAKKHPESKKT